MSNVETYKKMCKEKGKEIDLEFLKSLEIGDLIIQQRKESREKAKLYDISETDKHQNFFYGDCDSPYTLENSTATVFYIITMVVGTLFVDRWLIYIAATFIYIMFKRRHKKKK